MLWTEVLVQRDELLACLEPRLGRDRAWARANDIVQALVSSQGEAESSGRVLRILLRDLQSAEAHTLTAGVVGRWVTAGGVQEASRRRDRAGITLPRARRETRQMGVRS